MGVSSYFEFITTLFGWVMYDNMWAILADTGIIFIPVIVMFISHIKSSHQGGDDEGNAALQSQKKIEADFFAMMAVLIFAAIPMMEVTLSEMKYAKPALSCSATAETVTASNTGTTYDGTLASMAGETGKIPLWWAALHWLSKAVTSAAVASIPCSLDLAGVETSLAEAPLADPTLNAELGQFYKDCWQRAYSNYSRNVDPTTLTELQANSTNWIGSSYFLSSGLYDQYTARSPVARFPYDATRDASYSEDTGEGGYPTCNQWWQSGNSGLRNQLLTNLDPDLMNEMLYGAQSIINGLVGTSLNGSQKEDVFLRKYLTVRRASMSQINNLGLATSYGEGTDDSIDANLAEAADPDLGLLSRGWGLLKAGGNYILGGLKDRVSAAGTAVGGVLGAPSSLAQGAGIRHGVSLFQGLILMMFVIALPVIMIVGGYSLKTLATLSVVFFGLHFLTFLWAIAYWVDNRMIQILLGGGSVNVSLVPLGIFNPGTDAMQSMVLLYLSRFLYLVCPAMYLMGLGWVGIQTTQIINSMESVGKNAGAMGQQGGQAISNAAARGAKRA